jgi:subtilisin family serine protease
MRQWFRAFTVFIVLILATASLAAAAPKKADGTAKYLVAFKVGTHAAKAAEKLGFNPVDDWTALANAVSLTLTPAQAEKLRANPTVEEVAEEGTFRTMGTYSDNLPYTWGVQAVKAQQAWSLGARGQGIKVCILDTGIDYSHPEFQKNGASIIKGSKNFVLDGHADATDGVGHGTHVAGTIAAQGSYVWGVAPDVDLYIGRVLDDTGSGTSSAIMNGVNWCVGTIHANIISMSLGGTRSSKTEDRTYTSAYNNGTLVIAAAGNAGDTSISYPAGYSSVVSVAAVDENLAHASFSQYNSDVELAGPGVNVLSSLPPAFGQKSTFTEDGTAYTNNAVEYAAKGSVTGPLVECGLADTTTSCTNKPASGAWVALVSRGTIAFSDKANNVKAQGASAMVITNNDTAAPDDAGNFTFGSAGTWLPAVSISYNSGVAVRNGGLGTGLVKVESWNYGYYQGTSMATPHVAAVAALAWSAKPSLTNAKIRTILQSTAMDLGTAGRDVYFGYGLVQADAAVNQAKVTN